MKKISHSPRPSAGWQRATKPTSDPGQDPRSRMNTDQKGMSNNRASNTGRSQPQPGAASGSIPPRSR